MGEEERLHYRLGGARVAAGSTDPAAPSRQPPQELASTELEDIDGATRMAVVVPGVGKMEDWLGIASGEGHAGVFH